MLVFIDESGDAGFKLERGSSPVFVMSMVIFETSEDAEYTGKRISDLMSEKGFHREFKFNKCSNEVRDLFFEHVAVAPFRVRGIVVQKERIYSGNLRNHKNMFYNFFLKSLLKSSARGLEHAKIKIDGSGDRVFKRELTTYLKRELPRDAARHVRFVDSRNNTLIQLADMCAGAIARSYRTDRQLNDKWLKALETRIDDIWEFK